MVTRLPIVAASEPMNTQKHIMITTISERDVAMFPGLLILCYVYLYYATNQGGKVRQQAVHVVLTQKSQLKLPTTLGQGSMSYLESQ